MTEDLQVEPYGRQSAIVDSLPYAVASWNVDRNWRKAADIFINHLYGQGYSIVGNGTVHGQFSAEDADREASRVQPEHLTFLATADIAVYRRLIAYQLSHRDFSATLKDDDPEAWAIYLGISEDPS